MAPVFAVMLLVGLFGYATEYEHLLGKFTFEIITAKARYRSQIGVWPAPYWERKVIEIQASRCAPIWIKKIVYQEMLMRNKREESGSGTFLLIEPLVKLHIIAVYIIFDPIAYFT